MENKTREQWQRDFEAYLRDYYASKKGQREIKYFCKKIGDKKRSSVTVKVVTK